MKKNFLNDDKALEISVSRRLESVGRRDRPEYGRVLQRQNSGEVKRAFAWSERSSRSGARSHQAKACAKPGQRFERASGPASSRYAGANEEPASSCSSSLGVKEGFARV